MSLLQAIVLGLVQAVTEFLPISSSGHLILLPRLLGWPDQGLAFDEAVHAGTLLATMAYFRRELREMVAGLFASLRSPARTPARIRVVGTPGKEVATWNCLKGVLAGETRVIFGMNESPAVPRLHRPDICSE